MSTTADDREHPVPAGTSSSSPTGGSMPKGSAPAAASTCNGTCLHCRSPVSSDPLEMNGGCEHHTVLIIGGGVSGLSAACHLVQSGCTDVIILEARGRLGGRVVAIDIDGVNLQLGAMWIHGVLGNPMYELAVKSGLISSIQDQPSHKMMACREDGSRIQFSIVQEVYEAYTCFLTRCTDYFLSGLDPPDGVTSVGQHLRLEIDIYLANLPERERHARRLLFEHLLCREAIISGCADMDEVDLVSFGSYCELPGGNILPPLGYSSVLRPLRDAVPDGCVLLNHVVSRVQRHSRHVTVTCDNGVRMTADHVVCTVPLGVLRERMTAIFSPPLCQDKMAAVRRLGFGVVNKILLLYERAPLPAGITELLLSWEPDEQLQEQPMAQRWFRRIYSFLRVSDTLLMAWLMGDEAEYAETLPYHEIGRVCTQLLAKFLNDSCVPRPKHTVCTSWRGQPYSRGSYTYLRVGSTLDDIYTVAESVYDSDGTTPRVLFAGEHCHASFYSTVHGAFLSGKSAAESVLKDRRQTNKPPSDPHTPLSSDLSSWVQGITLH